MPRGKASNVGDTRVAPNGYHYTRTEEKWRLTHHLVAEKKLGRPLNADESVRFNDGNKKNLEPKNLRVVKKKTVHLRARLAVVEAKIEQYEAERDAIEKELSS